MQQGWEFQKKRDGSRSSAAKNKSLVLVKLVLVDRAPPRTRTRDQKQKGLLLLRLPLLKQCCMKGCRDLRVAVE